MSGSTNRLEAQENAGRAADQQSAPADDIFGDFGGGNNDDAEADDDYAAARSFAAMEAEINGTIGGQDNPPVGLFGRAVQNVRTAFGGNFDGEDGGGGAGGNVPVPNINQTNNAGNANTQTTTTHNHTARQTSK